MKKSYVKFICDPKNAYRGCPVWLYWSSELYSFGKYIRKYGYYPSFFPLAVYSDHSGPSFSDEPYLHEKKTKAPVFLAHRKLKVKNYIIGTNKKAYTLFSPAVFYRRSNSINQYSLAEGTVCFPVHSLPNSGFEFDIDKYCNDLKKLPQEYHPIKVCLHMHDVNNGTDMKYIDRGYEVVSAGNTSDQRFIERLYEIMRHAKYITSNDIGTITFLAVEMRVPFFVYGDKENTINFSDRNFPIGIRERPSHPQYIYLSQKLRLADNFKILTYDYEVILEVESALGVYDGISRIKMFRVLYLALFLWIIKFKWFFWLKDKMKEK